MSSNTLPCSDTWLHTALLSKLSFGSLSGSPCCASEIMFGMPVMLLRDDTLRLRHAKELHWPQGSRHAGIASAAVSGQLTGAE